MPKQHHHILKITTEKGKSELRQLTESQLCPVIANTVTLQSMAITSSNNLDLTEAVEIMKEKSEKIVAGDMSELESTLTAQIIALNAIFNMLVSRSVTNMGTYIKATEVYMRLALKAQAQCARTAEILATIKNPPIIFAKQANISQGHQQVNNNALPHAGENQLPQTKLLRADDGERLDTRKTAATGRANKELAPVGKIDRTPKQRGKSQGKPEQLQRRQEGNPAIVG